MEMPIVNLIISTHGASINKSVPNFTFCYRNIAMALEKTISSHTRGGVPTLDPIEEHFEIVKRLVNDVLSMHLKSLANLRRT